MGLLEVSAIILELITTVFIVLKISGRVDWSWWWVMSPFLLEIFFKGFVAGVIWPFWVLFVLIVFLTDAILEKKEARDHKRREGGDAKERK